MIWTLSIIFGVTRLVVLYYVYYMYVQMEFIYIFLSVTSLHWLGDCLDIYMMMIEAKLLLSMLTWLSTCNRTFPQILYFANCWTCQIVLRQGTLC